MASFLRAPLLATPLKHHRWLRLPWSSSFSTSAAVLPPTSPHLEFEQTQVIVHGRELAIVQPRDVDQVLDMYIKQGRLDGDPYWCRIWPSAIVLAEEILKNTQLVANLRVCDLGSGLGLAGVCALLAGAKEVVFFDQEPLALFCSLLTVHANISHVTTNLPFMVQHMCSDKSLDYFECLACGLALSPEIFHPGHSQKGAKLMARAEVFDWSEKKKHTSTFEMVLACDVLYEKSSVPYIAEILPNLICGSGSGKVIMTDPTHRTPQNREKFLNLINNDSGVKGLKPGKMTQVKLMSNDKSEDVELMSFSAK